MSASRPGMNHKAKRLVVETSLLAMGVTLEFLSTRSSAMVRELADWRPGYTISLGVLPRGPAIAVRKDDDRLVYLGRGPHDAQLQIWFKSVDSAALVLTGQCSAHMAVAERRVVVHGALDEGTAFNRLLAIATAFLFPAPLLEKLTKRMPELDRGDRWLKARLLASLGPLMLAKSRK